MGIRTYLPKLPVLVFAFLFFTGSADATSWYVQNSNPWGSSINITAMNNVFGVGNWTQGTFATPAATIFSPSTAFVMLEGSDGNSGLPGYISANQTVIENWVANGGRLIIHAAPNYGGNQSWGFDSTTLSYPNYASSVNTTIPTHPIFLGPLTPVTTSYSGNSFAHGYVSGHNLISILYDAAYAADAHSVLAYKQWGVGVVFFAGCSLPDGGSWLPSTQASNLWTNFITYAGTGANAIVDSFFNTTTISCSGFQVSAHTTHYHVNNSVKTYFEYSQIDSLPVTPYQSSGIATFTHQYLTSGNYTIKQVLYDGTQPIDSIAMSRTYIHCNTMFIGCYYDLNSNCVKDSNENAILQPILLEVDSNNIAVDTISVLSGMYYSAYGHAGDIYQFKVISVAGGYQVSCPIAGVIADTIHVQNDMIPAKYFAVQCANNNLFNLSISKNIPVTGRHDQWGHIYVQNTGCLPVNAVVTLYYSPKYVYSGGAQPPPSATAGNSITWNLNNVSNANANPIDLYYEVWSSNVTGLLTVGDTVQENIYANPTLGDADIANNVIITHDTVKGSCDPNHISVTPEGHISAGTNLRYQVEFENVGNDPAYNIYVLDTLPAELDMSSMRMVSSSHEVYVSKINDGSHNVFKFDFPNINLLDSSHHESCSGTFIYTIDSKGGLPDGTLIDHRVGIYFDYNGVVMTNTAENIIGFPTGINNQSAESRVELYPNPVANQLTIKTTDGKYTSLTITNAVGQVMMQQNMTGSVTRVSTTSLPSGVYYINLVGNNGTETRKFVKM